jgi:AcrR family transcriptional regulator
MTRARPETATGHEALSERRSQTVGGILAAAMQIVTDEGIAGLSMSSLASRAGVSRQTLYNYFPDVDAVLTGLFEMGNAGAAELAGRVQAEADPHAALRIFVEAVVEAVALGHPSPMALAAALPAALREALAEHEEQAEQLLVDVLRRGRDDGVFRADLDPELDGRILYRAAFAGSELAGRAGIENDLLTDHLSTDLLRMVAPDRPAGTRR